MSLEYVEEWGLRVLILKCGSLCSWIELISVCCAFTFLFNFAWASHCWMFLPWSVFTFQYSLFFFLHDLFVVRLDDSCVCCVFHFFSCKLWLWNYNQLVAFAKKVYLSCNTRMNFSSLADQLIIFLLIVQKSLWLIYYWSTKINLTDQKSIQLT